MSSEESADLLRDLVTGVRHESEPEVQTRLAADPQLAEAWGRHRRVGHLLERAGSLEDQVLAEIEQQAQAPGEDQVEATLRDLIDTQPEPGRPDTTPRPSARSNPGPNPGPNSRPNPGASPRPSPRVVPWLAAAAALVAVGLWLMRGPQAPVEVGPGGDPPDIYLGGPELAPQLLRPNGSIAIADLDGFHWNYTPSKDWNGSFEIKVKPEGSFETLVIDSLSPDAESKIWRWDPTAEQLASLRSDVLLEWQVTAISGHGDRQVSERLSFSLSR